MKICIVCPRLCHGGAERVAVALANGFIKREHKVFFFADLNEEQTFVLDEFVIVRNLVPQANSKLKKWGGAIRLLRKQMKEIKPDVIIGIMSLCSLVAAIASIGLHIPVIATDHYSCERPDTAPLTTWELFYKHFISRIFSRFTVLTEVDKLVIGKFRENVVAMPNPLVLKPLRNGECRKNVVLAAGRVDNWRVKGFDVLIRAWARVVSSSEFLVSSEGWKLVIAGVWRNPETRTYLDGVAEECCVKDKIEYTGFVSDMQKLYAESSIFVLSSRYEGFGLVLIEAMSQGCACVACDYKGRQREILDPAQDQALENRNFNLETRKCKFEACDTGILCEPDDVEALAEAMKKMIMDEEYRESVRAKAIERSKYYSIENTMDRWEALLKQVTGVKQL